MFEQKNTDLLSAEVGSYTVFAVFDFSAESRLEAELGPKAYERKKDGIYLGRGFSSQEDALRWLLSFGDKVLVTSPPEMVKKIKSTIKK
ncbi:MAG: WYL domain-containing protein [Oscillospiraceae bacterium]|nr:WYL domain-containing protein [Oscillospiraceae bacterium]